jgi:glyoxylase-like metal-dependent hydrolase (beta-lactamase superfamily II)
MVRFNNQLKARISRRDLLKGVGLGAAGLALSGLPGWFAAAQGQIQPATTYRFNVGQFEVTVIRDASGAFLPASVYGMNVEAAELNTFFDSHGMQVVNGNLYGIIQTILVKSDEEYILFDAGLGAAGGGVLAATLEQLGVTPDEVNTVLLSHYHPDHINGLTKGDGLPLYPNARLFVPQLEYDFLQGVGSGTAISDLVDTANKVLGSYLAADQVTFYNDEEEVLPGVQAILAPGHTPGHMAYLLESDGSQLFATVDVAVNAYTGLEQPDWQFALDTDPVQAVETRKKVFSRASNERLLVFGYHFPFPGVGYVDRQGDGDQWRWLPAAY